MRDVASRNLLLPLLCAFIFAAALPAAEEAATEPVTADPEPELASAGHPNPLMRFFGAQVDAARDEKKTLILAVYNSDEPSALSKVLLPTPEWKERVVGKYILMPLNLSARLLDDAQYTTMVAAVSATYPVKVIPGMIFLDTELLPVAQIHSQTTKEGFLAALDKVEASLAARTELNTRRAALKIENAKLLDQLVESALSQDAPAEALRGQIDEIIELDAEGKAGLKAKYAPMAQILDAQFLLATNNPGAAESALRSADASKLFHTWQELRMSLLLDAMIASGSTANLEATLTEALALESAPKDMRQTWLARAGGALAASGDPKKGEELLKKAVELNPQSKWALAYAASLAPAAATTPDATAATGANAKRPIATHDGKPFDLDSLKGKVVVIEFWSLANRHSPVALMTLSDLAAQNKDKAVFIAVNVGNADDCETYAAKIKNLTWVDDPTGILEDRFDVKRAPLTVLIDKDGKRVSATIGLNTFNKAVLEARIGDLLK